MRKFETPTGIAQLRKALEAIKANGGRATIREVATALQTSESNTGRYLLAMADTGCIRALPKNRSGKAVYVLADESKFPKSRPAASSPERVAVGVPDHGLSAHRRVKIVPARQIGMSRDSLVAALFGQR